MSGTRSVAVSRPSSASRMLGASLSTSAITMDSDAYDAVAAALVAIALIALARTLIRLAGRVSSQEHDGPRSR
jgi:hypothetical protein